MDKDMRNFCLIVFVTFLILSVITLALVITKDISPSNCYTTKYQTITAIEARDLIVSNNLTVADIRGLEGCGQCQFNKGHVTGAVRYEDHESLYNHTKDILVYSKDGTKGAWFCEQLVGHVYGKLYNMEGGWNAWGHP